MVNDSSEFLVSKALFKRAKLQNLIVSGVIRATTPQTGWSIWQKIKTKTSANGDQVCREMFALCYDGVIKRVGFDADGDSQYIMKPKGGEPCF